MHKHVPNAVHASLSHLDEIRHETVAFALKLYDGKDGAQLPLEWIEHSGLVGQFLGAIDARMPARMGLTQDLTQTAYVRTRGGRVFEFELADVRRGEAGIVVFTDGLVRAEPELHTVIAAAYQRADYDSSLERLREAPAPAGMHYGEQVRHPTVHLRAGEKTTLVSLYVYQDDPGKDWNKDYAEAHAQGTHVEAFGIDGLVSLHNELQRLKGEKKLVKKLVIAAHGSPACFRIGQKNTPFQSETRVGLRTGQTTPQQFAETIIAELAENAEIWLLTCETAHNGGSAATNGQAFLQQLSTRSDAKASASDEDVTISGTQASTEGNWYTATPGQQHPVVTSAKPAGNINP